MIDTHVHLNFKNFNKDRDEAISRSFKSGIEKMVNVGTDLRESRKSIELAKKYKNIYAAVGMHPHFFSFAEEISNPKHQIPNKFQILNSKFKTDMEEIRKLAKNKKVVAIGEIGLDYFSHSGKEITNKQKKTQKEGFFAQLNLAKELNLPVIIHCRASEKNPCDVYEDMYNIISKSEACLPARQESRNNIASDNKTGFLTTFGMAKIVFHCYGGDLKFTKKLLQHKNIYFSFTGNITYKIKKEIQGTEKDIAEIIKIIPLEKIMLETDCPFLAPQKFRGKRNEPAFVKYTAEKLAEIKKVNFKKIDKITTQTAEKFFGI